MKVSKFHSLTIANIEKTTSDCSVITFDIPETLIDAFQYKQGQYLTLKADINGEEVRRSYSLCSAPQDDKWQVAVKEVFKGKFSTFANRVLKAGDTLEVMPPNGRFYVECDPTAEKNYVAFAAGSGITPILSIIKTHLHKEPKSKFKLFYINQTVGSIILREEIEGLKNIFLDRLEIFHFLTRQERDIPFYNGRLNETKLEVIFSQITSVDKVDECFVCGPEAMIFLVRDFLVGKGMDKKKIHFELFNSGGGTTKKKERIFDKDKQAAITIIEGGKNFRFDMPIGSDYILDAALNRSADLPYACKGGVCATCRAKLIEGEVEQDDIYGLEQEEIDAGYVLTCRTTPISKKVVVNYDV